MKNFVIDATHKSMKNNKYLYLIFVALTGLANYPAAAANWNQWLGPQRNAISAETDLLKRWPVGGPKEVWRQAIGGGFSGIAVVNNRIYTMILDNGNEYIICFNVRNGNEIWRFKSGGHFKEYQGGDGPRTTPTVEDGRLYTVSAHGQIYALDAITGKKLWEYNLVKDFGGQQPHFGYSISPLIEGDLILFEGGGQEQGLIALDKKNGHVIWVAPNAKTGYSSPIAVTIHGVRQVVFFTGEAALGINPQNGFLYWHFPWKTSYDINAATPVFVAPDKIYISSGYDTGAGLIRLNKTGDTFSTTSVWTNRFMKNHFSTSVLVDKYLYGFDNSILKCLDANTGAERWKQRGYGKGTLIVADSHLIILGEQGNLGLAKPSPQGFEEISSTVVLQGKCWTVPTVANGKLYIRNTTEMVCLDLSIP